MHIAVRSTFATGVAVAGASAIALSPIGVVSPAASPLSGMSAPVAFSSTDVALAASFDPLTPRVDVITAAVSNAATIGEDWLADPLPAVRQVLDNWIGYGNTTVTALGGVAEGTYSYLTTTVPEALRTAFQQIVNGQPADAASTIVNALTEALFPLLPVLPLTEIPGEIANNFASVVSTVTGAATILPIVLGGALSPLEGTIQALGDSAQAFVDAVQAGDPGAALTAVWDTAPNVVGAVLNGYETYYGLLKPAGGLVHSLLVDLPQSIADALGAAVPVAATALTQHTPTAEAVASSPDQTSRASGKAAATESPRLAAVTDNPGSDQTVDAASHDGTDTSGPASAANGDASAQTSSTSGAATDGNKFEPGQVGHSGSPSKNGSAASSTGVPAQVHGAGHTSRGGAAASRHSNKRAGGASNAKSTSGGRDK